MSTTITTTNNNTTTTTTTTTTNNNNNNNNSNNITATISNTLVLTYLVHKVMDLSITLLLVENKCN